MQEHTRLAMSAREQAMELARQEMSAFERRESEFRKREREERAADLHLPLNADDLLH
jgi:hypothetical protein